MEDEQLEQQEQETPKYKPRPIWQVALAWVGLAVFVGFLIFYYLMFFRGGQ